MKNMKVIIEYDDKGCMVFSQDYPGAYGRSKHVEEALHKVKEDCTRYCLWAQLEPPLFETTEIVYQKKSTLAIHDADTDVMFPDEIGRITPEIYEQRKALVLKSAQSFEDMYRSIPKKLFSDLSRRSTFYGLVPRTAFEMYEHTNQVTSYYMNEIHVEIVQDVHIHNNRIHAFEQLEKQDHFLDNTVYVGNGNEAWNLAKVMRRFLWHDRIHALAMYRLGVRLWNAELIDNPYHFSVPSI